MSRTRILWSLLVVTAIATAARADCDYAERAWCSNFCAENYGSAIGICAGHTEVECVSGPVSLKAICTPPVRMLQCMCVPQMLSMEKAEGILIRKGVLAPSVEQE